MIVYKRMDNLTALINKDKDLMILAMADTPLKVATISGNKMQYDILMKEETITEKEFLDTVKNTPDFKEITKLTL